jgi:hypothetical protein
VPKRAEKVSRGRIRFPVMCSSNLSDPSWRLSYSIKPAWSGFDRIASIGFGGLLPNSAAGECESHETDADLPRQHLNNLERARPGRSNVRLEPATKNFESQVVFGNCCVRGRARSARACGLVSMSETIVKLRRFLASIVFQAADASFNCIQSARDFLGVLSMFVFDVDERGQPHAALE